MNQGALRLEVLSAAELIDCLCPANGAPYSVEHYAEIFGLSPTVFTRQVAVYRRSQPDAASASDAEATQRFIADVLRVILAVAESGVAVERAITWFRPSLYRPSNSRPRSNWSVRVRLNECCSFWPHGRREARDESRCPTAGRSSIGLSLLLSHCPAYRGCTLRRSRFCAGGNGEGLSGAPRRDSCGAAGVFRAASAGGSDGLPGKVYGHAAVWPQGTLFAARVPLLMSGRFR